MGYLGYFHASAIVNSAALNMRVHVSFQTMFFWGICPQEWDYCDIWQLYFKFLRNLYTVP